MKSSIFYSLFAAGSLIISTAAAQTSSTPNQPNPSPQTRSQRVRPHHRVMGDQMVSRLTKRLNLTPDQQTQARSIFGDAHKQAQALAPKLRGERQAMSAAIKSDNEASIDQIARQDAQLNSQARAIHAKAMAKFYSTLTADQKAKFDATSMNSRINARGQGPANRAHNS
jgi:Spy/CpxP family protein refolding chaperone